LVLLLLDLTSKIILSCGVSLLVILIFLLLLLVFLKKKKTRAPIAVSKKDLDHNKFVLFLGGKDNIMTLKINGKRINIVVKNITECKMSEFTNLNISTQVIENSIKMFIDNETLLNEIKSIGV